MSTDIHVVAQVQDEAGVWQLVTLDRPCSCMTPAGMLEASLGEPCDYCQDRDHKQLGTRVFEGYWLFSVLAGVRNDIRRYVPVAPPRGLPPDLPVYDKEYVDVDSQETWLGDHTHSWLTLAELQAYDWSRMVPAPLAVGLDFNFYTSFMPALARLGDPDRVRIVFGFDN